MKISVAIDAMGGDHAPHEVVKGAVMASRETMTRVILAGREAQIEAELSQYDTDGLDIAIAPADEVIEMGESPGGALKKKKGASIIAAVAEVAKGNADALVAAGNTGAAMASSLLGLGRLPGIDRPAIAVQMPTRKRPIIFLDAGANSDCEPEMLLQFASMGRAFSSSVLGIKNPSVGLLNIGSEEGKGSALYRQAYQLLEQQRSPLNFIGNVEGRELYNGDCEVVVCDGFVGNVTIKVTQGVGAMVLNHIEQEAYRSCWGKRLFSIAGPLLRRVRQQTDADACGGALLLGIRGIVVIAHGNSNARTIKNAIRLARQSVEGNVIAKISQAVRCD
jgi:phosphate acyltransferase